MWLGNDLVCLTALRRHDPDHAARFRQKVLTPHEQQLVVGAPQPDRLLWLLWSLKEAAYKYCQQQQPSLTFVATRFGLLSSPTVPAPLPATHWRDHGFDHLPATTTCLQTPLGIAYGRTVGTPTCLMSVVAGSLAALETVHWEIRRAGSAPAQQSAQVRQAAANRFRAEWGLLPGVRLTFEKNKHSAWGSGGPVLHLNNQPQPCAISFSHDAQYVAYAFANHYVIH
ncbi:4'-phosphopantetheinyl transferase family protein [Fibrella aquatilis]|uniref:4-phosphopantetheinyl transferase family protein n=1 Tax=Fibrella aquatilis TaxID=2817059 RepID=A0A939G995_9BACT|nr:4'-phosphopantetheinyl transferase superfamily protein [Fibrella aquatilis]MBO0932984.1 4-phosphopantetheinyl transferase family protein [Fibrella aquatilis]